MFSKVYIFALLLTIALTVNAAHVDFEKRQSKPPTKSI